MRFSRLGLTFIGIYAILTICVTLLERSAMSGIVGGAFLPWTLIFDGGFMMKGKAFHRAPFLLALGWLINAGCLYSIALLVTRWKEQLSRRTFRVAWLGVGVVILYCIWVAWTVYSSLTCSGAFCSFAVIVPGLPWSSALVFQE